MRRRRREEARRRPVGGGTGKSAKLKSASYYEFPKKKKFLVRSEISKRKKKLVSPLPSQQRKCHIPTPSILIDPPSQNVPFFCFYFGKSEGWIVFSVLTPGPARTPAPRTSGSRSGTWSTTRTGATGNEKNG